MKYCRKCDIWKQFIEFGKDKNRPDGLKLSCKVCRNKENKERRNKNPEKHRKINLAYARSEHGKHLQRINSLRRKFWPHLTNEQAEAEYDKLLVKQKHSCGLCKKSQIEFKIRFAVDHCHKTSKVRGLLCNKCNRFEVGRHTLQTAIDMVEYLKDVEES